MPSNMIGVSFKMKRKRAKFEPESSNKKRYVSSTLAAKIIFLIPSQRKRF
jgi:hypothetical protein